MKLRNKKTGEIKDACEVLDMKQEDGVLYKYYSLTELNKEWEDAPEEPDLFYYIDADGHINSHLVDDEDFNNVKDGVANLIAIGNRFETEEKAKKAEKKLEARERLRRKGFRFTGYNLMDGRITFTFDGDYYGDEEDRKIPISDDLYTLFGGEE